MSKVKDLLYDKNDILVALIILGVAAFIIMSRVDALMAFSERPTEREVAVGDFVLEDRNDTPPPAADEDDRLDGEYDTAYGDANAYGYGTPPAEETPGQAPPAGSEPVMHSLHIASGESLASIGRNLVSLGLFEGEQAFVAALEARNATTRVRAGNFLIPSDATADDVVRILTGISN